MEGLPEKVALNNNVKEVREGAKWIPRKRMGQVTRVAGAKALGWKLPGFLKEQQRLQCGWGNVGRGVGGEVRRLRGRQTL